MSLPVADDLSRHVRGQGPGLPFRQTFGAFEESVNAA